MFNGILNLLIEDLSKYSLYVTLIMIIKKKGRRILMKKMTSKELRKAWIDFYTKRGHVDIGATSLIGDGTTGVLFNVAGSNLLCHICLESLIHKAKDFVIYKDV